MGCKCFECLRPIFVLSHPNLHRKGLIFCGCQRPNQRMVPHAVSCGTPVISLRDLQTPHIPMARMRCPWYLALFSVVGAVPLSVQKTQKVPQESAGSRAAGFRIVCSSSRRRRRRHPAEFTQAGQSSCHGAAEAKLPCGRMAVGYAPHPGRDQQGMHEADQALSL